MKEEASPPHIIIIIMTMMTMMMMLMMMMTMMMMIMIRMRASSLRIGFHATKIIVFFIFRPRARAARDPPSSSRADRFSSCLLRHWPLNHTWKVLSYFGLCVGMGSDPPPLAPNLPATCPPTTELIVVHPVCGLVGHLISFGSC